jgi:hypothetical protein
MGTLAPICLFVYNRPEHTRRTLDALATNTLAAESELFVFSDGPKGHQDLQAVEEVRKVVRSETRFKQVAVHKHRQNCGLAQAVISGLNDLFRTFETVIVLEDDLVTSPFFLTFMNEGLRRYQTDARVGAIQGYHFGAEAAPNGIFFSRYFTPWGWATWRRAWAGFEPDCAVLLDKLKDPALRRDFNLGGHYNFHRMLEEQRRGYLNSWYIRWYASQFILGKLALWPGQSLVENIGLDDSGTHSVPDSAYASINLAFAIEMKDLLVIEDRAATTQIARFYRGRHGLVTGWLRFHCPPLLKFWVEKTLKGYRRFRLQGARPGVPE